MNASTEQREELNLEWWQETDLGLLVQQNKTGVKQIKTYSDRLRAAIELARSLAGQRHIIVNKFGEKYSDKGLNTLWGNARRKASVKLGVGGGFGVPFS